MRLKQVKLSGFKSFVDTTKISFSQQMTAIVGPNGCGKSNIIDAVRWVLGESSAKNLRGDAMTDVIFNGSSSRKPIGQANVELIFDNSDNSLQGSLAERNEISIRRNVTRDGINSYYLNGSKCRRKDITEIFLGTGLGPRSYAIIEQGTISRLIESKPQELRVFIEEAAGISKYKEKRRDTEIRIEHTRENLIRLNDVIAELTLQIDKLHQQAEAAKYFKTLKAKERQYKTELAAMRWQQYNKKAQSFSDKVQKCQLTLEALYTQQSADELELVKKEQRLEHIANELTQLQQQKLQLSNEIIRVEQQIKHQKLQYKAEEKQLTSLETSLLEINAELTQYQQKQILLTQTLTQKSPQLNEIEQQLLQWQAQLNEAQQALQQCTKTADDLNQQRLTQQQDGTQLKASLYHYQADVDAITDELTQQQQTQHQLVSKNAQFSLINIEQEIAVTEQALAQLNGEITQQQHQLTLLKQANVDAEQALMQLKLTKQHISMNLEQLSENECSDSWQKQQKLWLAEQSIENFGELYQQLVLPEKWQKAVESIIYPWLKSETITTAIDDLPLFKNHNDLHLSQISLVTNVLSTQNTKKSTNKNADKPTYEGEEFTLNKGSVAELFTSSHAFIQWLQVNVLNNIYLADSVNEAQKILVNLQNHESVLCADGTWLSHYFIKKGDTNTNENLLAKHREKTRLTEQLAQLTPQLATQEKEVEQYLQEITTAEQALTQLENDKIKTQQQLQQSQQQLALATQQQQMQQQQLTALTDVITQLNHKLTEKQQLLANTQQQYKQWQKNQEQQQQSNIEALIQQREQHQQCIQQLQKDIQLISEQRYQLTNEIAKAQAEKTGNEQQIQIQQNKQQQLTLTLSELKQQKVDPKKLAQEEEQYQTLLQQMSSLEKLLAEKQQLSAECVKEIASLNHHKEQTLDEINQLKEQVVEHNLQYEQMRLRAQTMLEQIQEFQQTQETQYELEQLLANLPNNAKESHWQANITRLAKEIAELGAINLAAIDEYHRELQRKQFLEQQYNDLNSAIETLESAITKIDKESKHKFKTTFDKVNQDFKQLFPKVFGGGSAYLALTTDDLLATGVTIMARPSGKKNSTIHLLSGGEKALTALSLVFAIFRLNPAPFCLLDEVDAPLDDTNVLRFCNLVEEMSKTVQFIYISHNKIAMEMAKHLMGVTMFEAGVSRMVAVDIDEAIAMAEA